MSLYYEDMRLLLEYLGAENESEIFCGVLLEKSRFKLHNHMESFYLLSQLNLLTLYEKYLRIYELNFKNFSEFIEKIACSTYTITYYFAGCYSNNICEEIENKCKLFQNENCVKNEVFLGLPWLLFSANYVQIKEKKLKKI